MDNHTQLLPQNHMLPIGGITRGTHGGQLGTQTTVNRVKRTRLQRGDRIQCIGHAVSQSIKRLGNDSIVVLRLRL